MSPVSKFVVFQVHWILPILDQIALDISYCLLIFETLSLQLENTAKNTTVGCSKMLDFLLLRQINVGRVSTPRK